MSATVDANILVYASNQSDPIYPQAIQLVTRLASGPDLLYLFWPVVLGYLRIVTHPAILRRRRWSGAAADDVADPFAPPGATATATRPTRSRSSATRSASHGLLLRLPVQITPFAQREAFRELARRYDNHAVYDVIYVALAERTRLELITADESFWRRLAQRLDRRARELGISSALSAYSALV